MNFMKNKSCRLISLLLSVLLLTGIFFSYSISTTATSDEQESLPENVEKGLILHCWCWNFNTIKDNIPKIAEAGFTAVQTSPINEVVKGDDGGMELYGDGKWYYQYQPTNYTIGNYQLGTEEEFKAMCETAHSYGVKVIVDVVANHTSTDKSAVNSALRSIQGGLYHNYDGSGDPNSRKSTTQWYSGLPDVNTQNPNYQKLILEYLKKCVADGADGFRYDTAKHIELPDDEDSFKSDFWPTVLENGSSFQYGEVLQGSNSAQVASARMSSYAQIMHVTASSYGGKIRSYLKDLSTAATGLTSYMSEGVSADRLVTWVESHDTYANGGPSFNEGTSYWLTNEQIRRGWALLTARGDTTSLFFSRPKGSEPYTEETRNINRNGSKIWGDNQIGLAGDENYFDSEVVAVNKFHNFFINEEAGKLVNAGKKTALMVSRGTKGAVIINNAAEDLTLNLAVTLSDGTYTDTAHGGTFTVKDGKLTGTVAGGQIAVLYQADGIYTEQTATEPETTEPVETEPAATSIKLSKSSAALYVGEKTAIKADVTNPVGDTTYSSSSKSIAKVSSKGKVTAVKKGKATITVKNNGVKKTFKVTVKNPKLNKTSITLKKKQTFTIKITGKNGKQKFKSSNTKVASVTKKGKVTAKNKGKATITVTTNGSVKLTLKVKVG